MEIRNLTTEFQTAQGCVRAVRNVSYTLDKGEILGVVGESGSGKSAGMLSLAGLLADNGRVVSGSIVFDGQDISPPLPDATRERRRAYELKMRSVRGREIGMIFQDPMSFLNPTLTIGTQITETIRAHEKYTRRQASAKAVELMGMVGIPAPERRLKQYPFEFSGGMRQRIVIAIALSCGPKLLIADEPTTSLDVTIQAQILELIKDCAGKLGTGVILITHDLGVVASLCDRISIMYGGGIMEEGLTYEIFHQSAHPYTKGLLRSVANDGKETKNPLRPIPGTPPDLLTHRQGCPFAPRCSKAMEICVRYEPLNTRLSQTHSCNCWLHCRDRYKEVLKKEVT